MPSPTPPLAYYPGLENMPVILGNTLYTIQADGALQDVGSFNQRFRGDLNAFDDEYSVDPEHYQLGTFLPAQAKQSGNPWRRSASLFFTLRTYYRLSSLEAMLSHLLPKPSFDSHSLGQEMSAYAGMRRLHMYGILLGYQPAITIGGLGEPIAINLRCRYDGKSEWSFQRHLRVLSLASLFGTRRHERAFVEGLFQFFDAAEVH